MAEHVDVETGEVRDDAELALVPLHIADLDEDAVLAMFPTPVQCAGALLIARERIAKAPAVLQQLGEKLRDARRKHVVEGALARQRYRSEGWNISDAKDLALSDERVQATQERVDEAELALEYGRDLRRTLTTEIDILRSLNANMREEVKR